MDAPAHSVPFLAERVILPAPREPADLSTWLRDLDDRRFQVRERATHKLEKLGEPIRGSLQQALRNHPSLESRRRIVQVLNYLNHANWPAWSPDELRLLRAIAVLERAGKPGRLVLETLVRRAGNSPLRDEAQAALGRMVQSARK